MLWGHIQMEHEERFDEVEDWESPDMVDVCYDKAARLWARIGMSLWVPEQEAKELAEAAKNEYGGEDEVNIEGSRLAARFVLDGYIDGESYIPEGCIFFEDD